MHYICQACDGEFERPVAKVLHRRRPLGHPDLDYDDDWIEICPECGTAERFEEVEDFDEDGELTDWEIEDE